MTENPSAASLGEVAAKVVARRRFQRVVTKVHALGPRVMAELLAEIGASCGIDLGPLLGRYAALDPEVLAAVGANRFPPSPVREVK